MNGPEHAANLFTKHLGGQQLEDESMMCKLHFLPGRHSSALKLTVDTEVINRESPLFVCLLPVGLCPSVREWQVLYPILFQGWFSLSHLLVLVVVLFPDHVVLSCL